MSAIEVGSRVRLKPRAAGVVDARLGGGEAEVLEVGEDARGVYYRLRLLRSDAVHYARRSGLVAHRFNRGGQR